MKRVWLRNATTVISPARLAWPFERSENQAEDSPDPSMQDGATVVHWEKRRTGLAVRRPALRRGLLCDP